MTTATNGRYVILQLLAVEDQPLDAGRGADFIMCPELVLDGENGVRREDVERDGLALLY